MLDGYPLRKYDWKDWLFMALASSLVLQIISMFFSVNIFSMFASEMTEESLLIWTMRGTVIGAILSLPLTLFVVHWRKIPILNRKGLSKEESFIIRGISKDDWKFLAKYIPISYVAYISGSIFLVNLLGESEPVNQVAIESMFDYVPMWQMFIMIVIVAPIAEELLFRGILLFPGNKRNTTWIRLVISAVLFGLVHTPTDILSFYTYVGMGFIFSYAAKKRGSVEVAIVYHFLNNLFGFIQILLLQSLF